MKISTAVKVFLILLVFCLSFASVAPSFPYAGSFTPSIRDRRKVIDERIAEKDPGIRTRGKTNFSHQLTKKKLIFFYNLFN